MSHAHLWVGTKSHVMGNMKEQTIVSILGIALLVWWISSGKANVKQIESDVQLMERLAEPWVGFPNKEKNNSAIYMNLSSFLTTTKAMTREIQEVFPDMTPTQLQRYLLDSLTQVAQETDLFAKLIHKADFEVSSGDSFVDGPFEISTQTEIQDLEMIIGLMFKVLQRARDVAVELLNKVGTHPQAISQMTGPLDALLPL